MKFSIIELNPFGVLLKAHEASEDIRDIDIEFLRTLFTKKQLVVLRGFRSFTNAEDFSNYCEAWGEVSLWPFGKVLELSEHKNPEDHIFDHSYVPLHWDGMYRPQVPEYQIFHCVSAPQDKQSGRTTFSHTARVLETSSQENISLWKKVTGIYNRKMEYYHSKTVAPIICSHPTRGFPIIRYNEAPVDGDKSFVNRPHLEFQGLSKEEAELFHSSLREALYASENFYAHSWESGDLIIADNYTLLHGREAFTSGAPRHLRRVHVLGTPPLKNPHLVFHT